MKENIRLADGHEGIVLFYDSSLPQMLSRHTHPQLELNIVLSGTATYILPGRKYILNKGSLVWLFPEQPHIITERSKNFSMYVIVFSQNLTKKMASSPQYQPLLQSKPTGYFCRSLAIEQIEFLSAICFALEKDDYSSFDTKSKVMNWAGEAYGSEKNEVYEHPKVQKLNAGLSYLLLEAWDSFKKANENSFNSIHPSVEAVLVALNSMENYPDVLEYNLSQLASIGRISSARLSRLFHAQSGTPLITYRNQKRLEYFLHLFQWQNLTISEAAYAAGFGSYAQFQKSFIKEYGYSPKAFKDKITNNYKHS